MTKNDGGSDRAPLDMNNEVTMGWAIEQAAAKLDPIHVGRE